MTLRWYTNVIQSTDPSRLAHWWAEAFGWEVIYESEQEVVAVPPWAEELAPKVPFEQVPPGWSFVKVDHQKSARNRIHMDFAPHTSTDRDAEIERLIRLGATRADVGQGDDVSWTVLADIDGNEFCVLSSRDS